MRIALAQGSPSCEHSLVESKAPKCPGVMWLQLCLTFASESDLITPVLRDQQWLLLHILILRNQVLTVPGRPSPPHTSSGAFSCYTQVLYPPWNKEALLLPACRTLLVRCHPHPFCSGALFLWSLILYSVYQGHPAPSLSSSNACHPPLLWLLKVSLSTF